MIYASYNSRLEIAFCMDEFLKPPVKEDLTFDLEQTTVLAKKLNEANGSELEERNKRNLSGSKSNSKEDIVNNGDIIKQLQNSGVNKTDIGAIDYDKDIKHDNNKDASQCDTEDTNVCDNVKKSTVKDTTNSGYSNKTVDNKLQTGTEVCKTQTGSRINKLETGSLAVKEPKEGFDSERLSSFINFEADANTENTSAQTKPADSSNSDSNINSQSKVLFGLEDNENKGNKNLDSNDNRSEGLTPELRKKHPSGGKRDKSPLRKSQMTQLTDHSDPLYSYQLNQDDSIFQSSITFQEQLVTHRSVYSNIFFTLPLTCFLANFCVFR